MGDRPLRPGTLGQVSLFVRDTARAEAFYGRTLGLPHLYAFGDRSFFDLGGVRLYLDRKDEAEWKPGSVLYFLVDDIQAATAEGRGVHFGLGPARIHTHADTAIEEWMAFFDDSEGNILALMSRVVPAG